MSTRAIALIRVTHSGSNSDHLQRLPLMAQRRRCGPAESAGLLRDGRQQQHAFRCAVADAYLGTPLKASYVKAHLVSGFQVKPGSVCRVDRKRREAAVSEQVMIPLQVLMPQHAGGDEHLELDAVACVSLRRFGRGPGPPLHELAGTQVKQHAFVGQLAEVEAELAVQLAAATADEIGRASCRGRGEVWVCEGEGQ